MMLRKMNPKGRCWQSKPSLLQTQKSLAQQQGISKGSTQALIQEQPAPSQTASPWLEAAQPSKLPITCFTLMLLLQHP